MRIHLPMLSLLLALGVFALDLVLPLGVVDGVAYVLVVLVALWSSRRWCTYTAALVCSGLTILGFLLSPPGNPILWMVAGLTAVSAFVGACACNTRTQPLPGRHLLPPFLM
jgi:hypothetical protein